MKDDWMNRISLVTFRQTSLIFLDGSDAWLHQLLKAGESVNLSESKQI